MREWARKQDLAYYWRSAVRQVIADTRAVVTVLQREGYMTGMVGRKMLAHIKAQIRAALDMMRTADSVEVAGSLPPSAASRGVSVFAEHGESTNFRNSGGRSSNGSTVQRDRPREGSPGR